MHMPREGKGADWLDVLDADLAKRAEEIHEDIIEQSTKKAEINRDLTADFWRIWLRFNKINVHLTIEPPTERFANFSRFPDQWSLKEDVEWGDFKDIQLIDRTQDQGRVGDSIKAWYYARDSKTHFRMVFEYCEGEHYYKYAGWKRIFSQYVLYDAALDKYDSAKVHDMLTDVIRTWYESHLRRDREIVLKHLKDKYEKGETFTQ